MHFVNCRPLCKCYLLKSFTDHGFRLLSIAGETKHSELQNHTLKVRWVELLPGNQFVHHSAMLYILFPQRFLQIFSTILIHPIPPNIFYSFYSRQMTAFPIWPRKLRPYKASSLNFPYLPLYL